MDSLFCFWAKLGSAVWPDQYHPVICHLIDVAAVTSNLWNCVIRSHIRQWLSKHLGVDEKGCGRWLAFWSGAHDIGKVAPCFQSQGKTDRLTTRLRSEGFDFPGSSKPHGDISTQVLAQELGSPDRRWPALTKKMAQNVAVTVGGHHGVFPTNWDEICELVLGNKHWAAARRQLLADLARLCGVSDLPSPNPSASDDKAVWMYVAGLTSVADWIGSNQTFFEPFGNPALMDGPIDVDGYFRRANGLAVEALEKLGWLDRADRTTPVTFTELFPFKARPLQTTVAEIAWGMAEPILLIVEAPMGEGKTEAGWYTAVCWERRHGQGTYVALPTMATSNQMFDRVGQFLEADSGGNLMLLHGKAALNNQFEKLRYAALLYDDKDRPASAVVAEGWFAANKKHGLLAPYGVGTIDQALLAVLQTKHVFVRLLGLAGKCVILDEVHAYDAYMTTLMERLLRWLAALGCPVVLLSATLPRDKRLKLLRAYAGEDFPEPEAVLYPRVTSVSVGRHAEVRHIEADPARARTIRLGWLDEEHLAKELRQALANGGCAAVIRNTVGLAQDTYLRLRDVLKGQGIAVELFHARFPFGRRMEIENAVLKRFGKEGTPAERDKRVLVATQVVEQSLDLDFDLMVSDVAPVDLVLQRAGRLWRHQRSERLGRTVQESDYVPLWLIEPPTGADEVPDFGVSGMVYSRHVLFRSLLALRSERTGKRDKVQIPFEIDALINQVYEDSAAPDSLSPAEQEFWERSRADHREAIEKEECEAETRQIKKPRFRGALARLVQEPREEDNPDLHPAHQALTRLTRPTVLLICLDRDDNGSYRLPHDNSPVHTLAIRKMSYGGLEDVGRLMLGEVTSAHRGVINQLRVAPLTPTGWGDVGLLCRHHLILFTKGKARLGAYELVLDNSLGLTIIRAGVHGEDE